MVDHQKATVFDIDPNRLNTLEKMEHTEKQQSVERDFIAIQQLCDRLLHEFIAPENAAFGPMLKSIDRTRPKSRKVKKAVKRPGNISVSSHAHLAPMMLNSLSSNPTNGFVIMDPLSDLRVQLTSFLESHVPSPLNIAIGLPFPLQARVNTINALLRSSEHVWHTSEGQEDLRQIKRVVRRLLLDISQ